MKIKVNTKVISKLNPCKDRFDNWKYKYPKFNGDIIKFLRLTDISHSDKLWVTLRLIPSEIKVIFALDCAFSAYVAVAADAAAAHAAHAAAAYAAAAAYYAAYAAYAAAYTADAAYAASYAAAVVRSEEQTSELQSIR